LVDFFQCTVIHGQLSEQFSESQAVFGTTFRDTGGHQKAGASSLNRVLQVFSQFVSDSIEASRNLFKISFTKRQAKIVKTICPYKKNCFDF
jgi:hypothetical protein